MKKITLGFFALIAQISYANTIELPADTVQWRPSPLPGYQLVLQKCSACHSAHYAEYQPPSTGLAYWNAQVLRMKNVFKAPVTDEDVPVIVEYLNASYGKNRK